MSFDNFARSSFATTSADSFEFHRNSKLEPLIGVEPMTYSLRMSRSTN